MTDYRIALIPGDGIGPEVIAEAEKVLDAATESSGTRFERTRFSLGAARSETVPGDGKVLRMIMFGACSSLFWCGQRS